MLPAFYYEDRFMEVLEFSIWEQTEDFQDWLDTAMPDCCFAGTCKKGN